MPLPSFFVPLLVPPRFLPSPSHSSSPNLRTLFTHCAAPRYPGPRLREIALIKPQSREAPQGTDVQREGTLLRTPAFLGQEAGALPRGEHGNSPSTVSAYIVQRWVPHDRARLALRLCPIGDPESTTRSLSTWSPRFGADQRRTLCARPPPIYGLSVPQSTCSSVGALYFFTGSMESRSKQAPPPCFSFIHRIRIARSSL
ncbi:uncharacterized protein SCHCODRAFT_02193910 [Schizophyllum commune H4-8]|uniref:uncharacterized protein n=1 Tax=Schizophyllum commune (strain H4-8 / FGSC 9210) TaxID=578458 RepID=UPI00215F4DA8|nr:uncharacterized protein SCHCODRAFT_02193910 [Schizophyllum commune H4-8]KAI5896564.1 hypothetical protein SCHCODRAFT_02193910 [Schizophyllum commune H4-8]